MSPDAAVQLLRGANVPFWIAGGVAIDLFVGGQTRSHQDLDVQIVRGDDLAIAAHLVGWDLQTAHQGQLAPWVPGHAANAIWCRPSSAEPWTIELVLVDVVDDRWIYRRDPRISRRLADIELRTPSQVPFVRPEIQLLYKSKAMRERDEADFQRVLPLLDTAARRWLRDAIATISPDHKWISRLERSAVG